MITEVVELLNSSAWVALALFYNLSKNKFFYTDLKKNHISHKIQIFQIIAWVINKLNKGVKILQGNKVKAYQNDKISAWVFKELNYI